MRRVQLDAQDESVKQFVLALKAETGSSILELNGKPVACVVPPPKVPKKISQASDWTEANNKRRCDLIDREIDGLITPQESAELGQLQDELLRYQQRVAPWPIEAARKLHHELLKKAAKGNRGSQA